MMNPMIIEGIRNGIKRGQSLKQTMISFYNAGYSRQDIEDSARAVQSQLQPVQQPQQIPQIKTPSTNQQQISKIPVQQSQKNSVQNVSSYVPQNFSQPQQKIIQKPNVSSYSYSKESFFESKGLIIFLLVFLILCLGALFAVFFFKQELINFFNSLF